MNNVEYFFTPRNVAVVGASTSPAKGGYRLLKNVLNTFKGPIYAVNAKGEDVLGLKTYKSLLEIPEDEIDLVLSFVPNKGTAQVARDAVQKGCKAFLVQSGGFADSGGDGAHYQDELIAIAKASPQGMRVWGPNCGGMIKANPAFSNSFIMVTEPLTNERGAAFISQSGMLAGAIYLEMVTKGQPQIASTSTIGNRADINESDIMEYLESDPNTDCVTLYLESIKEGRRFVKALRRVVKTKPVVALVPGRSEITAQAAASHTGSLLNNDRVKDAVFKQYGVTRVDDFTQFLDFTKGFTLLRSKPLKGSRVAIMTHTGAGAVVGADTLGVHGFQLAELSPETKAKMATIMPAWAAPGNPADIWSTIEQVGLDRTHQVMLDALLSDPGVDAVLLLPLIFDYFKNHDFAAVRAVINKYNKPVVGWFSGIAQEFPRWKTEYEQDGGVAFYDSIVSAVKVLAAWRDFQAFRARSAEVLAAADRKVEAPAAVKAKLAAIRAEGRKTLTEAESKEVLKAFGIPVPMELLAPDADAAAKAAAAIGYPVVLKISSPDIAHKTEMGGVRVGLKTEAEVRQAVADMQAAAATRYPGAKIDGYLVAEMVAGGTECIVGVKNDRDFGPTVMFGLGGIFVEVFEDIAMRVAPLSRADAEMMVREIKGRKILEGARGQARGDIAAVVDTLLKVSDMAVALDAELEEFDLNPLAVLPEGKGVRALDALMVLKG
ncbi:MAG TPA: acetate--CoA ligase family protein [Symbiobacteriaceae bacterium]|nr:acetate--CoA ligase family protein [Symbiobacteriaceae bacterium]